MFNETPLPDFSAEARIRVKTLGRFVVEVEGKPLRFDTRGQRKPFDLLKVLIALGAVNVPEEQLSEALWPDADGDAAHKSFTSTLHRLRRLIGHDTLHLRDKRLSLDPAHCRVDALDFERAMEHAAADLLSGDPEAPERLERGLSLYGGPFLDGEFDPPEILPTRERLHGILLNRVEEAGRILQETGSLPRAIALYRRALEVDPLSESINRDLMRCYLASGETAAGLTVYQRCRELLKSAMDVEPSEETERVYRELQAEQAERPEATITAPGNHAQPSPPEPPSENRSFRRRVLLPALAAVLLVLIATGSWLGYRAWSSASAVANLERTAEHPLPDKPSLAVLALDNLTGEDSLEYLSDGITETLLTALARNRGLFVVARSSSFRYKGKAMDVRRIGRELGVRYVLEGSLQQATDRIRVNVQLIDASDGRHTWSQKYDRPMQDLFDLQDDIALNIANELNVELVRGEWARSDLHSTRSVKAYDLYLRAQHLALSYDKEPNLRAIDLLKQALELDPEYARAMGLLGWRYLLSARFKWLDDPARAVEQAEELANSTLAIQPDVNAYTLLARLNSTRGNRDRAIEIGHKAVALEPSNAWAHLTLGYSYVLDDRPLEGLPFIERAIRLAPSPPPLFLFTEGKAHFRAGHLETSLSIYREILANPNVDGYVERISRVGLIEALMGLGRVAEARKEAEPYRNNPEYSVSRNMEEAVRAGFTYDDMIRRYAKLLREAGLPE